VAAHQLSGWWAVFNMAALRFFIGGSFRQVNIPRQLNLTYFRHFAKYFYFFLDS